MCIRDSDRMALAENKTVMLRAVKIFRRDIHMLVVKYIQNITDAEITANMARFCTENNIKNILS